VATPTLSVVDADSCARQVLDVVPLASRWLRAVVRQREASWSLPQLHTLGFLRRNPGASLSDLAAHLGVGAPTASTLVTRLVAVGQVERREDPAERRRILLTLTPQGERQLEGALGAGRDELADRLRSLPAKDLARVAQAMAILGELFTDA
jgi:DNA-binding MarR family transcriptional regulator